jgi:lysophospholipase L1-like esterase
MKFYCPVLRTLKNYLKYQAYMKNETPVCMVKTTHWMICLFIFAQFYLLLSPASASGKNEITIDSSSQALVAPEAQHYQWYENGERLKDATDNKFSVKKSGYYSVEMIHSNGEITVQSVMVAVAPNGTVRKVYLIGDSTVCNYSASAYPQAGWGQMLPFFFDKNSVVIDNRAIGGRSSRSFYQQGRWTPIVGLLQPGDFVFIQFGHNDRNSADTSRYTSPTDYKKYLTKYVNDTRSKGAFPVLVSPMIMNAYSGTTLRNVFTESGNDYRGAMLEVATNLKVPFIDLNIKSFNYIKSLGQTYATRYVYHTYPAGEYPNYPNGNSDGTHFQEMGAIDMARFVVEGLTELKSDPNANALIPFLLPTHKLTVTTNNTAAGLVTHSSTFPSGATVTLKTIPATGHTFSKWTDAANTSITQNRFTFVMGQTDKTYNAFFDLGANKAPTVSITSPANNASFTAPASITINATAADADGTVSNVQFYNGTTLLGSDASSPYSFSWTSVPAGTYALTARATDNNGAVTTSSAVTLVVNNPIPVGVTIQAETACTFDGVLNEATNAGFNGTGYLNLNNAAGSAATWVINSSTSQTVSLSIRYANASAASRNMSLRVNGTSQVATINFPSTAAWTTWTGATVQVSLAAGRNTIQLTSLIAEGAPNLDELTFGSSSVSAASCTVSNQAPAVSINSPVSNTNYIAPAGIAINASATDADGTVSKVEFYNGNTLLGSDAASPYSFVWNNVAAGTYTLTARATDNSGAVTISSAVAITVSTACTPTAITPYVQVNGEAWTQTASANVNVGDGVNLGPQPTTGGSWSWTGPNGFSATTREIALSNIQANQAGNYVATYTNAGGCNSSSTFTVSVNNPQPTNFTIQAETACIVDGTLNETFNAGYHGTGYVNTDNFVGASASWAINSQAAQTASLSIRYAHTTATGRPMSLSVNAVTQVANIAFGPTASNTTWVVTTVQINLSAGLNTIKMVSTQSIGSPYIDELTFNGVNISAGTCAIAGSLPQAITSPNPSSDVFTLTVPEAAQSITVSDMSGIVVYSHGSVGEGETIQFGQNLGIGTFMMTIIYASGRVESKKIQKTL